MANPASEPTNATLYTDVLADLKALLPRNYIGGLITSNDAGDAVHDVNIAAGECRDPTDAASLRLATEITKQIDAAWAVGDDAGGIDAGAVAVDTLYALWLIKRSDTGVVDALFSTSFTAPTMPGSYDYKRLIGAVRTDGGSDIIAYTQSGDYFRFHDPSADVSDTTIVDAVFEVGTLLVPPLCLAHVYAALSNSTSTSNLDGQIWVRPNGMDDAGFGEAWSTSISAGNFDYLGNVGMVLVDSASQIQYAAKETTGDAIARIWVFGFTMLTRREP